MDGHPSSASGRRPSVDIGRWSRIVEYPRNHLNDFCLFQALDGRWHAVGIQGTGGTWASETSLFHCSCDTLRGMYEIHGALFATLGQGDTNNAAPQKHAPFVVVDRGLHHLYFRRPPGTNLHLASADLVTWPWTPDVVFEERDARDACIRCFRDVWHWYYVQHCPVDGVSRSCVMVRRSHDLTTWSDGCTVFVDGRHETRHSRLESPTVVAHGGLYWLFVRDRWREDAAHPAPVTVWTSEDPASFESDGEPVAVFSDIQAPEIVEEDGRLWIARVSGGPHAAPAAPADHGWLEIAELSI
jgi:hypothetical protein